MAEQEHEHEDEAGVAAEGEGEPAGRNTTPIFKPAEGDHRGAASVLV